MSRRDCYHRPPVGKWWAARNKQDGLDDPSCGWCNRAERMHVRHDIVTSFLFLSRSDLELLRIQVLLVRVRASYTVSHLPNLR